MDDDILLQTLDGIVVGCVLLTGFVGELAPYHLPDPYLIQNKKEGE